MTQPPISPLTRRSLIQASAMATAGMAVGAGPTGAPRAKADAVHSSAAEPLDRARTALVLIEFQREWLADDGTLQTLLVEDKAAFRRAVDNAAGVLDAARSGGWTIAHAGLDLRHDPDYALFNGGRDVSGLRAAIPKAGTWTGDGAQYVEPFVPRRGEFQAVGRSGASVLKNATLDPFLRNRGITTLLLMGFATHVCVESSLREAHDLGYNAVMVHDACAAFEAVQHEHVRRHVVHHFGTEIGSGALVHTLAAA